MQLSLELLAPARNKSIGISAIDCGADAVYIAGPAFGAREAAANPISEIGELASYAHRFGVRVYMTLNTILYDSELEQAEKYIWEAAEAGCDAIIIQDLGILKMKLPQIDLYASTQCNIRTTEQAQWLESLGFKRLILERALSLDQIRAIRAATSCELETFVHGALCVSYSGQCYLSQALAGRSANRGCCIQACRSKYDLVDSTGKVLLKDKTILSLKDFSLDTHIEQLVDAGISSFKIEGRLKSASYVKNITRYYREIIDTCANRSKTSSGLSYGGFEPNPDYTFSRGYTKYFIDGERGQWNSRDSAKSVGEYIGKIARILSTNRAGCTFELSAKGKIPTLSNGDGLCIISAKGESIGLRADVAQGAKITTKPDKAIEVGCSVYRNLNVKFEKEVESNMPRRLVPVILEVKIREGLISISAEAVTGEKTMLNITEEFAAAENQKMALENIRKQLEKNTDIYDFGVAKLDSAEFVPFVPLSVVNSWRRTLASELRSDASSRLHERKALITACANPLGECRRPKSFSFREGYRTLPQQVIKLNCSNHLSREVYNAAGINPAPAFELATEEAPAAEEYTELMRTKYCIKYELGLCHSKEQLYLINNGRRLKLLFDCKRCEMVIIS